MTTESKDKTQSERRGAEAFWRQSHPWIESNADESRTRFWRLSVFVCKIVLLLHGMVHVTTAQSKVMSDLSPEWAAAVIRVLVPGIQCF